jgi:hypothetical protein
VAKRLRDLTTGQLVVRLLGWVSLMVLAVFAVLLLLFVALGG